MNKNGVLKLSFFLADNWAVTPGDNSCGRNVWCPAIKVDDSFPKAMLLIVTRMNGIPPQPPRPHLIIAYSHRSPIVCVRFNRRNLKLVLEAHQRCSNIRPMIAMGSRKTLQITSCWTTKLRRRVRRGEWSDCMAHETRRLHQGVVWVHTRIHEVFGAGCQNGTVTWYDICIEYQGTEKFQCRYSTEAPEEWGVGGN